MTKGKKPTILKKIKNHDFTLWLMFVAGVITTFAAVVGVFKPITTGQLVILKPESLQICRLHKKKLIKLEQAFESLL
jgi:hypothetical protein